MERGNLDDGDELKGQRYRASASALIGTALEYFDFQLYGLAAALIFNHLFFPTLSPAKGMLSSFGI